MNKNKLKNILLFSLIVLFLSFKLFSEKTKDYTNYKNWQFSTEKNQFLQLWEETESNYSSYNSVEYREKIKKLEEVFLEIAGQQKTDATNYVLKCLEELCEATEKNSYEVIVDMRIKTSLSIINYMNIQTNIMANNTNRVLFLLLILIIILVIFVFSTMIFARRLKKSQKNEQVTSDFNQKIIDAQEKERKRISLELHDTIAQNLGAIQLLTSKAFSSDKNDSELQELKNQVLELESKSIIDIRTLCYNLTPPDLDRKDLRSTLTHFCSTFTKDTKIECSLVITEDCDFSFYSPENQLNIFRLVQEALNNAAKHSKAEEITVVIRKNISNENTQLRILITDDGIGFNLESAAFLDSHFGLKSMKERAKFLGGTLKINTAPNEGTEVQINIPYKEI